MVLNENLSPFHGLFPYELLHRASSQIPKPIKAIPNVLGCPPELIDTETLLLKTSDTLVIEDREISLELTRKLTPLHSFPSA